VPGGVAGFRIASDDDVMMRKLPVAEIVVASLALLAGVGVYVWAHADQATLEESKALGANIVAALQEHRAETGTYPADLADLVPRYLPQLDPPTWGMEQWTYRRYTPAEVKAEALAPADERAASSAGAREGGGVPDTSGGDPFYFQLSVAANASGYPVLYYDYTARRWVLNN
jgi:hypothetical protein